MNVTLDTFARAIVGALGTGILAGAALALLVAFAIRMLRPSATTQHALWWIVLTAAVALPIASASASFGRIEHHAAKTRIAAISPSRIATSREVRATSRVASQPLPAEHESASGLPPAPPLIDVLAIAPAALERTVSYPGIATLFVAVWLFVATLRIGVLGYGFVALMRMKAESVALDESVVRKLRRFRYNARTGRPVALLVSSEVDVPVAVGFSKPAILIPTAVAELEDVADLDQIAMHEHAHLNRYDDVTNFLQCAFEAIFWFNPVVWLVGRQISLQREIACDDSVIAQTGRAHRYATCLWKLVESARLPSRRVVAPGALFTPKQITTRIEQLLDSKRNALPRLSPVSAIALATLSAALIFSQALGAPVIALEDPAPPAAPAVPAAPALPAPKIAKLPAIEMQPLAVPSPAPAAVPQPPAVHAGVHRALVRIAIDATPEAIATAVIDAAMKRSLAEVRRASRAQAAAAAKLRSADMTLQRDAAHQSAALAKSAAAMGTGFGLDVARQLSEQLAPLSEWPAIERSLARAKKSAQRQIADVDIAARDDASTGGNHRSLGAFRNVRVDGSFDVVVRRGASPSVDFQNDTFVASHTHTEVSGDTLVIDQTNGSYSVDHPKEIVVTVASLEGVEINGSANVRVVDSDSGRLSVHIAGSGDLAASGNTGAADVTIEGSGNADLARVRATSVNVDIEGSGDVTVGAPNTLSVRIAGSGDVRVHGTPKHISSDINGSGEITKI